MLFQTYEIRGYKRVALVVYSD